MKTFIAAAIVALTATQVQADGFYQDIVANNSAERIEIRVNSHSNFVSPLYRAVTGGKNINVGGNTLADNNTSYSILYETVTGRPQAPKQDS